MSKKPDGRIRALTKEQYEYLIQKVNELTYSIDLAKTELKNDPKGTEKILLIEKQLMQLETRMDNLLREE